MELILEYSSVHVTLCFAAIWSLGGSLSVALGYGPLRKSAPHSIFAWLANTAFAVILTRYLMDSLSGVYFLIISSILVTVLFKRLIPLLTTFGFTILVPKLCIPISIMYATYKMGESHHITLMPIVFFLLLSLMDLIYTLNSSAFDDVSALFLRLPRRDEARRISARVNPAIKPKVSIHVPCYSEPPELVIATLKAISRLKYRNFEVLVVDNNTKDPSLWKPVEAYCHALGLQFRFFHVDPISGAKAGALNFATNQTASDAEIISVIDADYICEPDFLDKYVPLFEDPQIGFVQTSHDYREWENSRFLTGAYYEYTPYHKLSHPSLSEFDSSFTVGTMCLVRREALEKAGGWAEWCLTEDSEVAVRIHALGYTGHSFADTAGRGLIPETMAGVKRQQFRWSAGPIQQFLRHWKLYLGISSTGRLRAIQRYLETIHSVRRVGTLIALFTGAILPFQAMYFLHIDRVPTIPQSVILLIIAGMVKNLVDSWVCFRLAGGKRLSDYVYVRLMRSALEWTFVCSVVAPLIRDNLSWHRTNKFKESFSFSRAFHASRTETALSFVHFGAGLFILPYANFIHFDLVALSVIFLMMRAATFMSTLVLALLRERELFSEAPKRISVEHLVVEPIRGV